VGFKNVKKYSIPKVYDTTSPLGNMRHFKVRNEMKKDISKDISTAIMLKEMSQSKHNMSYK